MRLNYHDVIAHALQDSQEDLALSSLSPLRKQRTLFANIFLPSTSRKIPHMMTMKQAEFESPIVVSAVSMIPLWKATGHVRM